MTVVELVERERATLRRLYLGAGVAGGAAAALALLALGALILGAARWLVLPRLVPFVVWAVVGAACAVALRHTRRAIGAAASRATVAERIETEQGLRAGSVRGVLEVGEGSPLGRYAAAAMATRLGPAAALAPGARKAAARQGRLTAVAAGAAVLCLALVAIVAGDGLAAVLRPVDAWRGTLLAPLSFAGAPARVLRGDSVELRVRAPGRARVRVARRAVGGEWSETWAPVDPRAGTARVPLGIVDADLRLVATDGRAYTDTLSIAVTDRPFVGDLSLRAEYPAYLGRPAETLAAGEPLRLPRGTRLLVAGRSSVPLDGLDLVAESRPALALVRTGYEFAGTLPVTASGSWRFRARARAGAAVDVPAPLEVEMLADSAPRVELREPAADTTLVPGEPVRLVVDARDDHALGAVAVRSWRERAGDGAGAPTAQTLASPGAAAWQGEALFAGTGGLEPGDRLHLVVTATDRSPWRQVGESRELVLRVPSLGEQREGARRLADSATAAATAVATAQKQLEQRSGELSRMRGDRSRTAGEAGGSGSSKGEPASSFESAERARALAKQQRELAAQVDSVRAQARRVERQLRQAGALDSGLSARLEEAQRLLREALTPELAAKLAAMESAAAGQSGEDARSAMQELAREQQRTRQQLEQGVEMLKRAALEGAMQTLGADAREVATRERQLADSLGQGGGREGAARELAARSRALADEVKAVEQRLEREGAKAGPQRMSSAAEHARASAREMAGASPDANAKTGGKQEAAAAARAAAEMEQAARDLAQARDAQVGQWKQELTRDLDQSIQETMQLAREERALAEEARAQAQRDAGGADADSAAARTAAGEARDSAAARGGQPPGQAGDAKAGEKRAGEAGRQQGEAPGAGGEQSGAPSAGGGTPNESGEAQGAPKGGAPRGDVRSRQSTLQQGTNRAAERLEQAGRKSALVSPRAQRAMADARRKVEAATKEAASGGAQSAAAMQDAAAALNQAAAAMVRDRERANSASSASGLPELLQRMREAAKQQGQINQSASGMGMGRPGGQGEGSGPPSSLARQQRRVAQSLEEIGDADASGRTDALAKEARDLARALDRGAADEATLARQQRLHRRLLDAGRSMEKEEREDNGRREAQTATGSALFTPDGGDASGRAGSRYTEPTWGELRGLSAEERRVVIEYFKRLNAQP